MDKGNDSNKSMVPKSSNAIEAKVNKSRQKTRSAKRRRIESDTSSDGEDELPENMLETEKHLHASAVKNNLDEVSVRKILKKVVTNDHVLALVKLREEEENELDKEESERPAKLTRSKVKELMKVSPKCRRWDIPLTPIKHIPVKTRPEVTALIAQDLPEDEDDDEYEPTHDDVPSDDDQTVESCSDLDSQPRTPATPLNQQTTSPKVVKDGPFKVPPDVSAIKRKLDLEEEEATIARRTRSKLSLSSTSIEHIESTFVPPDDLPTPAVDDLWNQFLSECLNPASTSKNEDDDDADPEYNVAADPDALDEDDDNLSKSIIKISKKELNDLVTELFEIMPEVACEDLAEDLANSVLTEGNSTEMSRWEGKQETMSDEEGKENRDRLQKEGNNAFTRFSMGKSEPEDCNEPGNNNELVDNNELADNNEPTAKAEANKLEATKELEDNNESEDRNELVIVENEIQQNENNKVEESEEVIIVEIKEEEASQEATSKSQDPPLIIVQEEAAPGVAPPLLRHLTVKPTENEVQIVQVHVNPGFTMLPDQVLIFQQQLRQHVQLSTSNYLQLYAHPIHWNYARHFKEYVKAFLNMTATNPDTLANVCNLKQAYELMCTWETALGADTPENTEFVKFIDKMSDRCRRRTLYTSMPMLDFPEQLKQVVANSPVFLYPHLLPPTAYRPDQLKRSSYTISEDSLIALGLQEFKEYVESNPAEFSNKRGARRGLHVAVGLLVQHLMPWTTTRIVMLHLQNVRKHGAPDNPINKLLKHNIVDPVDHKLLPFNPTMTLHEQPANEIPRLWLKYLSKTNSRIKNYLAKENSVQAPKGVSVKLGQTVEVPKKKPMPIDFIPENSSDLPKPDLEQPKTTDNVVVAANLFSVVQTEAGMVLVPLTMLQNTTIVDSQKTPIMTPAEVQSTPKAPEEPQNKTPRNPKEIEPDERDHCECCKILRRILCKQNKITNYFKPRTRVKKPCYCTDIKFPRVSNRLRLFLGFYSQQYKSAYAELQERISVLSQIDSSEAKAQSSFPDADDLEYALQYQCRLLTRISVKLSNLHLKKRLYSLFNGFNLLSDDPVSLAQSIHEDSKGDLVHVYNEFLGFLNPQQAENCGVFPFYFQSHVRSLMKRVQKEISDAEKRKAVLMKLKEVCESLKSCTSCEACKLLLSELHGHPELAKYVFSLFPHKTCQQRNVTWQPVKAPAVPAVRDPVKIAPRVEPEKLDSVEATKNIPKAVNEEENKLVSEPDKEELVGEPITEIVIKPIQPQINGPEKDTDNEPAKELQVAADVQVNQYVEMREVNAEDSNSTLEPGNETQNHEETERYNCVKSEPVSEDELDDNPNSALRLDTNEDSRESPDDNMVIVEKDIEAECHDWTRDEDKLLLEIIKQYLASPERKNKSVFQILQEKGVYQLIAERLSDKSKDDIVQRVLYLLELVLVE